MKERERRRALYRAWDGEAAPGEASEVESHLSTCADCRRAAEILEMIRRRVSGWPQPEAPRDLTGRALEGIRRQAARVLHMKSRLRLTAAAAALLLAATLAAIPLLGRTEESPALEPVESIADIALDTVLTEIVTDYQPRMNDQGEER